MARLNARDADLHNPDGTHRSTPGTSQGKVLEAHARRLREHLATHEMVAKMVAATIDENLPG